MNRSRSSTRQGLTRGVVLGALGLAGSLWPAAANACAVCFSGSPRIRLAFFNTTILLSLLPLVMIFGGLWYLRRSGKVQLAEEFTESDYSLPEQDAAPVGVPQIPVALAPVATPRA